MQQAINLNKQSTQHGLDMLKSVHAQALPEGNAYAGGPGDYAHDFGGVTDG